MLVRMKKEISGWKQDHKVMKDLPIQHCVSQISSLVQGRKPFTVIKWIICNQHQLTATKVLMRSLIH